MGMQSEQRGRQDSSHTTLHEFVHTVRAWLHGNLRSALKSAIVGATVGYALNALMLLFVYDSSQVAPGALAFGQGNALWGSLGFGLGGLVFGGIAGYWRAVGSRRFFESLDQFPAMLGQLLKRDGQAARVHLLWGAAVSLVAATLISPWVGLLLAAGMMSSLPSILGRLVSALVLRLWSDSAQRANPASGQRALGVSGVMVGILGGSLALCAGFFLPGALPKLAFALACAIVALILSRRIPPSLASLLILAELAWLAWNGDHFDLIGNAFAEPCKPGECVPGEMGSWGGGGEAHHHAPATMSTVLAPSLGSGTAAGAGTFLGFGAGSVAGAAASTAPDNDGGSEPDAAPPTPRQGLAANDEPAKPPTSDLREKLPPAEEPPGPQAPNDAQYFPPSAVDDEEDLPAPEQPWPGDITLAPLTASALLDTDADLPDADAPADVMNTGGDLDADATDDADDADDADTPDDLPEEPMPADTAPQDIEEPPPPPGPTPEEVAAANQAKRDKLHDIISTLKGMEDIDKRNQLIGIVRNAARLDNQGIPQGDMDRIADMVDTQAHSGQPPGALAEALEQLKDFGKGVREDVGEVAKAVVKVANDPKAVDKFWDGAYTAVNKGGELLDRGLQSAMQFGKDFVRDTKDLVVDPQFRSDFLNSAGENLDQAAGKIKSVTNETVQMGKDIWKDPSILSDTFSGTIKDLQDPKKVEEAFRNGVPGGDLLLNATDKKRPVLDRLRDGLLGAASWAGTAESVIDARDLLQGGAKMLKNLGDDWMGKAAKQADHLADDAARVAARAGPDASDASALASRQAKGLADETPLPNPLARAGADDAAALSAKKAGREIGDGADDLLKTGDDLAKTRTPGTPESKLLPPQGTVERGTHVRNIARQEGYRDDLANRLGFEDMHKSGNKNVLGHTRGSGQNAEAVIHSGAFDQGPTSLRSTVKHEVDHVLQHGQLQTQAAPHGPKADWVKADGKWTPKGREMAEMEVRIQELDRNLVERNNAILRNNGNLTDRSTWPQEALDADREIEGARKWLSDHGVGKKTTPEAPNGSIIEPAGEDLFKVAPSPPAMQSIQKIPGFENPDAAKQWVKDFKKTWAGSDNLTRGANDNAELLAGLADKPGAAQLAKDLVDGKSQTTTSGASGALSWARSNVDAIKSIEASGDAGRRGADFLLERKDAMGNVVREVAEVKTYSWNSPYYQGFKGQAEVADKIVEQLAARAANPDYAGHGLRLALNDMDQMPPRLKDLIHQKIGERGLTDRVKIESFDHYRGQLKEPYPGT